MNLALICAPIHSFLPWLLVGLAGCGKDGAARASISSPRQGLVKTIYISYRRQDMVPGTASFSPLLFAPSEQYNGYRHKSHAKADGHAGAYLPVIGQWICTNTPLRISLSRVNVEPSIARCSSMLMMLKPRVARLSIQREWQREKPCNHTLLFLFPWTGRAWQHAA